MENSSTDTQGWQKMSRFCVHVEKSLSYFMLLGIKSYFPLYSCFCRRHRLEYAEQKRALKRLTHNRCGEKVSVSISLVFLSRRLCLGIRAAKKKGKLQNKSFYATWYSLPRVLYVVSRKGSFRKQLVHIRMEICFYSEWKSLQAHVRVSKFHESLQLWLVSTKQEKEKGWKDPKY